MKFVLEVIIETNCKPENDKNIRSSWSMSPNFPNSSYFESFKMLFVINCENHFFVDGVKPLGETYSFLKRKKHQTKAAIQPSKYVSLRNGITRG